MYLGVGKFPLEEAGPGGTDLRAFKALCQKIKQRFNCSCVFRDHKGRVDILVSLFAQNEHQIDQSFDRITALIEEAGFGRVGEEACLVEHIDSLTEE